MEKKDMMQSVPSADVMYNALLKKDSSFEGIFFVAVKTTGIFCRPTCTARKPKREHVEFFKSVRDALTHGYRPCKLCNPLGYKGEIPGWMRPLIDEVDSNAGIKLGDADIRKRGIDPVRVRRWFQKNHGITFQTYLRALRIGNAFGRIRYGEKITSAAFDSGYESLSGFSDSFKKIIGTSPKKSNNIQPVIITRILTPLGPMLAGATEKGICLLEFVDRRMLETQLARIRKYFKAELIPGTNPHFIELSKQISEYFSGKRIKFDLPLVMNGTAFQEKVWMALLNIPYGETRSYKDQAEYIKSPKAIRAVAKANGDNRISIIIPCHRVIGSNGELVGYGGGLWRKKYLLNLEARAN
jgi:AraC family transcriptional regulator, regulatory protein of adaptative response / methylated-DNA-[protein]-cysteine methyltransferase